MCVDDFTATHGEYCWAQEQFLKLLNFQSKIFELRLLLFIESRWKYEKESTKSTIFIPTVVQQKIFSFQLKPDIHNDKHKNSKKTQNKQIFFLSDIKEICRLLNMYKADNLLLVFTVFILFRITKKSNDIYDGGRESHRCQKQTSADSLIPFWDENSLFIFIAFQFKSD